MQPSSELRGFPLNLMGASSGWTVPIRKVCPLIRYSILIDQLETCCSHSHAMPSLSCFVLPPHFSIPMGSLSCTATVSKTITCLCQPCHRKHINVSRHSSQAERNDHQFLDRSVSASLSSVSAKKRRLAPGPAPAGVVGQRSGCAPLGPERGGGGALLPVAQRGGQGHRGLLRGLEHASPAPSTGGRLCGRGIRGWSRLS